MSGRKSRDKGQRREREFAKLIQGERIPLSGAAGGRFGNDVEGLGLKFEVKAKKDGFKTLYKWLEDEREKPDALALKADRKDWLVVMKLDKFIELMGGKENE
jgi:Holliday junction resolvase